MSEEEAIITAGVTMVAISCYIHCIINEVGRLIFGLLSGYKFSSFKLFGSLIVNINGKNEIIALKDFPTPALCSMRPPNMEDDKFPIEGFTIGGSILDFVISLVCSFIALAYVEDLLILDITLHSFAIGGYITSLYFILPMGYGGDYSDAMMDKKSMKAYWCWLNVLSLQLEGVRIKDMSEEFFFEITEEAKNAMTAKMDFLWVLRLIDQQRLPEAIIKIEDVLEINSALAEIYRKRLICLLIVCKILCYEYEGIEKLLDKEQLNFIFNNKEDITVLLTECLLSMEYRQSKEETEKIIPRFKKVIDIQPYREGLFYELKVLEAAEKFVSSN